MSNTDNISDLIKFIVKVEINKKFSQYKFMNDKYFNDKLAFLKRDINPNVHRQLDISNKASKQAGLDTINIIYNLLTKALLDWRPNIYEVGQTDWMTQFQMCNQLLWEKTTEFPKLSDETCSMKYDFVARVFVAETKFMMISDKFMNRRDEEAMNSDLIWNQINSLSILPVVIFSNDKNKGTNSMIFKLGILRKVYAKVIWIEPEIQMMNDEYLVKLFSQPYVSLESKFLMFEYVLQKILQQIMKNPNPIKTNCKMKFVGFIISNPNIFYKHETLNITNKMKELFEWLKQNKDNCIHVLFILSYKYGPILGWAEIKNFNDSSIFLDWHKYSSIGNKLDIEPIISKHLSDQFFVIENGKQIIEKYEMKLAGVRSIKAADNETKTLDSRNKSETSKDKNELLKSFKYIYDHEVNNKQVFQFKYFIFNSREQNCYQELIKFVESNMDAYDPQINYLYFVTNEGFNQIKSLCILYFSDGFKFVDLQTILLENVKEIKNTGGKITCEEGRILLILYYESLNRAPVHLKSIGCSCYLTSILQCLNVCFHLKEIEAILDLVNETEHPLAYALFMTLHMISSSAFNSFEASDMREAIAKYNKNFGEKGQQDGYEFLLCLMKHVEKELKLIGCDNGINKRKNISNVFRDKFGFFKLISCTCRSNHTIVSEQFDYAAHISSYIYDNKCKVSLKDCWNEMFGIEKMDELLCHKCCQENVGGEMKTDIKDLPQFLICYINRWGPQHSKNETEINFELNNFEVNCLEGRIKYKAVAICNHQGTLDCGHYTALVRGTTDRAWFRCDEMNDKIEAVLLDESNLASRDVYAIFYERQ